MTPMDRQQIAEMIRAYGRATPVLEAERLQWLAQLTPHEARAIYDSLCRAWEQHEAQATGLEGLEPLIIERLIQVRQAFERVAAHKGLL
jgi:hypothetical protein